MNLKKILISSVLKPVDDVRHYKKFALSLKKANKYQIFIFGKGSAKNNPDDFISFLPTGHFGRLSLKRFLVQFKFMNVAIRTKPDVLLLTTIELLPVASFLKLVLPFKLVFDVQEDYVQNLKHQKEYTRLTRAFAIPIVKFIQALFYRFVDHFTLAETVYTKQFIKNYKRITVLENKTITPTPTPLKEKWRKDQPLHLLFTGSLSDYSGVLRAVDIFERINKTQPNSYLTIIGTYHSEKIKKTLKSKSIENNKITLFIEDQPIAHERIINEIQTADLGIISYQPNPVNSERIPTKLYEYASYNLPYLLYDHPNWVEISEKIGGGIAVNLIDFDPELVLTRLNSMGRWDASQSLWTREESELLSLFNQLIE